MATKTPKYELQKKEDNDFYNIEDLNANWDKVENALTEFDDSGTAEGITSFTDMLAKLVTGNKLAVTLRNLKAGLQFVLHTGSIVNNCVTDNAKLPLSAAQGKVLQDAITKLNGDLQFASLTKGLDLNVAIERRVYCETSSLIVGSLKNKPSSISSGEAIVIWLPSSVSNKFGCQLFFHTSESAQSTYLRHRYDTKWSGWGKITLS